MSPVQGGAGDSAQGRYVSANEASLAACSRVPASSTSALIFVLVVVREGPRRGTQAQGALGPLTNGSAMSFDPPPWVRDSLPPRAQPFEQLQLHVNVYVEPGRRSLPPPLAPLHRSRTEMRRERPRLGASEAAPACQRGRSRLTCRCRCRGGAPTWRRQVAPQDLFEKWAGFSRRACPKPRLEMHRLFPAKRLQFWS